MRERTDRRPGVVLALGVALASAAPTAPAGAFHDEEERMLDRTAYALRQGEVRLGFFNWGVGVLDELTIGTLVLPWVVPLAAEAVGPNGYLESNFWGNEHHAIGLHVGLTYVLPVGDGAGSAYVLPILAEYSYRIDERFSLHVRGGYAGVFAGAGAESADYDVDGNAVAPLVQVEGTFEWRLTRAIAVIATVNWVPWVGTPVVRANASLGEAVTGEGELALSNENVQQAYSVIAALAYSWKHVDLRIGFGYGDFFLLDTGIVVGLDDFFPEIAFDVRF